MTGMVCRIVLDGELDRRFECVLDGFVATTTSGRTVLEGNVADQSQLAGVIDYLLSLGIRVVSFTTEGT